MIRHAFLPSLMLAALGLAGCASGAPASYAASATDASAEATTPVRDAAPPSDSAPGDTGAADGGPPSVDGAEASSPVVDAGSGVDPASDAGPTTRVLLFGGQGTPQYLADTWTFDGATWTQLDGAGPSGRWVPQTTTWGPGVLLFGGMTTGTPSVFVNDTWTFDGAAWTEVQPNGPSNLESTYVATIGTLGGKVVLLVYGGDPNEAGTGCVTWTWDGTSWTKLDVPSPSDKVAGSPIAVLRDKLVLFAGGDDAETWTFDGTTWTQLFIPQPAPRVGAMATLGEQVVLFGGYYDQSPGTFYGDTWTFDGSTWTQLAIPGPPARGSHGLATLGDELVLFGGEGANLQLLDDTWVFDGTKWTQLDVTGPSARVDFGMTGY